MLEIEQDNPDEIHIYVQGTTLKFTIIEYAIISGLKCLGNIEEHLFSVTSKSSLMTKYFPGSKSSVKRSLFIERFKLGNFKKNSDALNMSIIYFIHTFLYSQVHDSTISKSDFVMVENGSYGQFPWGKSSFEKLIALWRQDFFVAKQLYSMGGMPHELNVWMYECCSKVVEIKVKYEKFMAGMFSKLVYNNIRSTDEEVQSLDLPMIEGFQLKEAEIEFPPKIAADCFDKRSAVERKIVRFDSTTAEEQVCQKAPSFVSTRTVPTQKIVSSGSEHVHAEKTTPSLSLKSVCQDNSDEKWDDIKLFLQSYVDTKINCLHDLIVKQHHDSNEKMDKQHAELIQLLKHHSQKNEKQKGEEKTGNIPSKEDVEDIEIFKTLKEKEKKDVEGCSEDNATAIPDALVESVLNHNSDNTNVGTSITVHVYNDHMDVEGFSADFGSATLEFELDAILKVIAAPVDDVSIEVVPPVEPIVNQHDISDSQLPLDFSDAVVAAYQAAKTPSNIVKRIRTRSKVFKSPYTTKYASGSKAIGDQIEKQKQQFTFDGFLISDTMSSSIIEEFKQWVEEGLLKFHAKKYYEDDTDTVLTTQQDYVESVHVALIEEAITHIIKEYCMPSGLPWHQTDEVDCGVFVAGYAEYLSEEMNVPSDGFEAEYHRMRYATLLRNMIFKKQRKVIIVR
ncbi:uncharacterized protein LOC124896266 [Capsicum annuum]|uniref:uncharacterized protein LOC124896266 n=1 Tax=Capsicum annuum TaxID=4072 RepID=UPI001FB0A490|nr:uncharacterized protein LOC124896266 [Capsicum annuum]